MTLETIYSASCREKQIIWQVKDEQSLKWSDNQYFYMTVATHIARRTMWMSILAFSNSLLCFYERIFVTIATLCNYCTLKYFKMILTCHWLVTGHRVPGWHSALCNTGCQKTLHCSNTSLTNINTSPLSKVSSPLFSVFRSQDRPNKMLSKEGKKREWLSERLDSSKAWTGLYVLANRCMHVYCCPWVGLNSSLGITTVI